MRGSLEALVNYATVNAGGSIAGITVSLILRRMSCDIPLAQSTKNHFSNWVYEELVGHTHPGVNGVYMHPMDGDMDGVPALLDSLLDERLSLGRAKRMLLSNGQTK